MKVLIIGAGKLGYKIATALSATNTDITIVDISEAALARVSDHIDVMTLKANAINASSLGEIGVSSYDIAIVVSGNDQTNIISSRILKELGCPKVITRITSPEFVRQRMFIQDAMNIDYIISPELTTSNEIASYLLNDFPFVSTSFAQGKIMIINMPASSMPGWCGKKIMEIETDFDFLIIAIKRSGKVIIPNGSTDILEKDNLYLIGNSKKICEGLKNAACPRIIQEKREIKKAMIVGGGRVGLYLAINLAKKDIRVKIIEKDQSRCNDISENTGENVLVLNGDGSDINLLYDEELDTMDAFIGATGHDEANLLMALMAKHAGVKKSVAKVSKTNYVNIIEQLGVDATFSSIDITASEILKYIKGKTVLSLALLLGGEAEITEYLVDKSMPIANKTLSKLGLPPGIIFGAILKNDTVIIPNGSTLIEPGDRLVTFCLSSVLPKFEKYIYSKKGGLLNELWNSR